jgi:hypothetical protein
MTPASTVRARTVATLFAAAGLSLLVAACGGSGPASTGVAVLPSPSEGPAAQGSASPSPASSGRVAQAVAYAQCMRAHGVPRWPDPQSGGAFDKSAVTAQRLGVSDSQLQASETACQALLPTTIAGGARSSPDVAEALMFSRCMRSHGVASFPDPDGSGRIPDPASLGIDQGTPRFEAANQACGEYRPPYMPSNAQYQTWASAQP